MWLSPLSSPNGVWRVPNMLPSPMLPLLHLHHIWSSTSGPHLYSVVSKLGSLDALGGINTRTHCRFKSAQSHEVDPAYREEKTKTVLKIHVYERNNFAFLQKEQLFLHFFWIHKYSTGFKSRLEETGLRVWENFSAKSYRGKVFQYCLSYKTSRHQNIVNVNIHTQHKAYTLNCSCLDRPCPDPREESHAQNNHLKNQRWNCVLLTLTNSKPGQNNYNAIQTCPIRKRVNP